MTSNLVCNHYIHLLSTARDDVVEKVAMVLVVVAGRLPIDSFVGIGADPKTVIKIIKP